jgi:hypothetical protein
LDTQSNAAFWIVRSVFGFFGFAGHSGAFAAGAGALEADWTFMHLEMAGELLPLEFEGQEVMLCNITECLNCLDEKASEWGADPVTGEKIVIKPVFNPNRFVQSTLFKAAQCPRRIFCLEYHAQPEDEFKAAFEAEGLKGLIFQEVWSISDEELQ